MTRRGRTLAFFLLLVVASFLARGVLRGVGIVDLDEAAHVVGSWELLRGRLPYTDFADHKPPLVYVYFAGAQLALGRGMHSVRLFTDLLWVPLTALAASAFFRHDRRGAVAALATIVYGASFLGHDMLAVNCELLMMLPLGWAAVLLREEEDAAQARRLFLGGLLVGGAVLFKYQAAGWLPALAIAAGASRPLREKIKAAVLLSAGFVLPLGLSYVVFWMKGGAEAFVYWNLTHNLRYTVSTVWPREALERSLQYLLPFLVVTAPLWRGSFRSPSLFASPYRARLAALLVVFAAVPAALGLRFYPHYFVPLYFALAVASAPALEAWLRWPLGREGLFVAGWTAVVFLGFTVANAVTYAATSIEVESRPVYARVAARLRADPCYPRSSLFVWGFAPSFYYEADRPAASRFLLVSSSLVGYVSGRHAGEDDPGLIQAQHWDWLMGDLEKAKATFVLDTADAGLGRWRFPISGFPRLARYLDLHYEEVGTVDGVRILRRYGCESEVGPG